MMTTEIPIAGPQAEWWVLAGNKVQCQLCPRLCSLDEGGIGFCGARGVRSGSLISYTFGRVCVTSVDSIEKKPMFHYRPGSKILSVGTFGCNLDCDYCQNHVLARSRSGDIPCQMTDPDELVRTARDKGVDGIAWTFNDPIVWAEYVIECSQTAHRHGLFSMLNTNGYLMPKAREDLLGNADAIKVDIKGFSDAAYERLTGGRLRSVMETCKQAVEMGKHLELAYILIPGMTDDADIFDRFGHWVADELGADIPVHLFRFQPAYRMEHAAAMSIEAMRSAQERLVRLSVRYVYLGGIPGVEQDTYCPKCGGAVVIRRSADDTEKVFVKKDQVSRYCPSYSQVKMLLKDGMCPYCGSKVPIRLS